MQVLNSDTSAPVEARVRVSRVDYAQTGKFSKLVTDYLSGNEQLRSLVDYTRDKAGFAKAFEKMDQMQWPREVLYQELSKQYSRLASQDQESTHSLIWKNIEALREDAYCTVTAHQLNFFTGPLYVIYKAVSAINLAKRLSDDFPDRKIVPVFWLGSEDHDLDEIDHFSIFGKTVKWETDQIGPAGRLDTAHMELMAEEVHQFFGQSETGKELASMFDAAYQSGQSLADAHFTLLHTLFAKHGLVVINADTRGLKQIFAPVMQRELEEGIAEQSVKDAVGVLNSNWHVQAAPRNLNLFVFDKDGRSRLDRDGEAFKTPSGTSYTKATLIDLLKSSPEAISPNVLLRPVHQQMVLPAVATIGGGGELAYWLQLRDLFAKTDAFYPVLMLRNSVLWIDKGSASKLDALDLKPADLFSEQEALVKDWVGRHEEVQIDLSETKSAIDAEFEKISTQIQQLDKGLVARVQAEKAQMLKSVDKLQGKLMKAAKDRHAVSVGQLRKTQDKLFPAKSLQERSQNFAPMYLKHGAAFIDILVAVLEPTDERFTIIEERNN